jgi:polyphosphate kinase 2 (PPK2 family)
MAKAKRGDERKGPARRQAREDEDHGRIWRRWRSFRSELCHLQDWVKGTGARVIVVLEGRDAAGKGGFIKALTERVSPRVFRVAALPAPSEREKTQMFMQRYIQHFPAGGEIVIFDRSWYNRAGVEFVMGFCTKEEHHDFLEAVPHGRALDRQQSGIILIKIWLEVGHGGAGQAVPRPGPRSPAAVEAEPDGRGVLFTLVRLFPGPRPDAGGHGPRRSRLGIILRSDDKKRARLNGISHILSLIPYERIDRPKVELPKRSNKHRYDDQSILDGRRMVPTPY